VKLQCDGSVALYRLATQASSVFPVDAAPLSPTPQVELLFMLIPFHMYNLSFLSFPNFVLGIRPYRARMCLNFELDTYF